MKQHYKEHEIIRGRLYRYDPDFDAYYPVHQSESAISKHSWIAVSVILAAIAYYIEFHAK
jgi:hypothetical protein